MINKSIAVNSVNLLSEISCKKRNKKKLGVAPQSKGPNQVKCIRRFAANSAHKPKFCTDLISHSKVVYVVEFSEDGSLLLSGGQDKRLLLWRTTDILNHGKKKQKPIEIDKRSLYQHTILCSAINPDNTRIFSGGLSGKVVICDVQT